MATSDHAHILTADEIWAAKDIEERTVDIPQWGGSVRIRTFSKEQADVMRKRATSQDRITKQDVVDNEMLEALLFVEGVIEPHFSLDDYEKIQKKSAVAVSLVLRAIMDASGLSQLAVTEATKSTEVRSESEIRVSPGAGIEDDANGIAQTNEHGRVRLLDSAVQPGSARTGEGAT
jgi:hypothetical protein